MFRNGSRLIHVSTILGVVLVALLMIAMSYLFTSAIEAEGGSEGPVCSGTSPAFITKPGDFQTVNELVQLELYSSPSTDPVVEVEFYRDNEIGLGNGSPVSGNNNLWANQWPSGSTNNGPHVIYALVHYDGGFECFTPHRQIDVQNAGATAQTELRINVLPDDSWTGPANVNFQFQAEAILVDGASNTFIDDVTDVVNFSWTTSIGAINANGPIGNFFSGPSPGTGEILLNAHFDGQTESEVVTIEIFDANNPPAGTDYDDYFGETGPSDSNSGDSSSSDKPDTDDSADEPDEAFPIPQDPNKVDYKLAQCLQERLGDEDYQKVLDDQQRLSKEQFDDVYGCFSTRRFVIPASIAPVDPSAVLELLEQQHIAKIHEHKQAKTQEGLDAIEFSGIAEPDSPILIYIFSEPLVLAGQTDSDGNWTYTLEDPLEPGHHEAYVVVDTDEGYVRSGSFGFEVAQASATEENPYGYSLALVENDTSQFRNYFIVGIATLVLIASIVLTRFVWFKPHKHAPVAEVTPTPLSEKPPMPEVGLDAEAPDPLPHKPGDTMHPETSAVEAAAETAVSTEEAAPVQAEDKIDPTTESEDEVSRRL